MPVASVAAAKIIQKQVAVVQQVMLVQAESAAAVLLQRILTTMPQLVQEVAVAVADTRRLPELRFSEVMEAVSVR